MFELELLREESEKKSGWLPTEGLEVKVALVLNGNM
jgi:hypothetical protein